MHVEKVYVNTDYTAVFLCPVCGKSRIANVEKFKEQKEPLKIKCACKNVYAVQLEFRKAYRKRTNLAGLFHLAGSPMNGGRMVVQNVSMGGLGFTTKRAKNLNIGDIIEVKFTLDDGKNSEIKKKAEVRVLENDYVGCKFIILPGVYDASLGFYLKR